EAVAVAGDVVVPRGVLLGVGDVEQAAQVLDVERGEALGDVRVPELAGEVRDPVEVLVIDLDGPGAEVGGVEQDAPGGVGADGRPLVNGPGRRIVDGGDGP